MSPSTTKIINENTNHTIIPSPTDTGALANRINFNTREQHNKIDKTMSLKFAMAMKHGFIYRQGLLAFYFVFKAIEEEIQRLMSDNSSNNLTGEILRGFWMDEFYRTGNLYNDLCFFYSKEFPTKQTFDKFLKEQSSQLPSKQQDFIDYIHEMTLLKPWVILAYCHVEYLALFAGGRVMRSTLYKNSGLFPSIGHLSKEEISKKGTKFFTFSEDGVVAENKLRMEYRKNFEIQTRNKLSEQQKLDIIEVAGKIFDWNASIVNELGQINRDELMNKFSFRLITFIFEELKASKFFTIKTKNVSQKKLFLVFILALLQILITIGFFKMYF
ncbi:Hmx1p SCDLUD_000234 [Saccharomycodes ludwigii]|uniref:Hmx1p n=1 Tax=Saccharomycodes ludwigii TaxID=36035 RepID=UPI001E8339CD|nr:hypothetical protein SCDLUD_000234 [Saccharomycodes ludwigii]KAH3902652.1 hypothetical protein SCDLUD_000234 [Saccharomycodes ludwigii]